MGANETASSTYIPTINNKSPEDLEKTTKNDMSDSSEESLMSNNLNATSQFVGSSVIKELEDDKKGLNLTYDKPSTHYDQDTYDASEKSNETLDIIKNNPGFVIDEDTTFYYTNLEHTYNTSNWRSELGDLTAEDSRLNETLDEPLLYRMRNFLADYQETRGTSREEYTFSTLIRIMGQSTGKCLEAIFYVLRNVIPVFEVFLHILRFVFDKIIDINSTTDMQQKVFKVLLFMLQLLSIYICLVFIFGFIVAPVVWMAFGILAKIMLYD